MNLRRPFLPLSLTLACLACLSLLGHALAAVTLVSFTATPAPGQAMIRWETASEVKIAGYYVNRSLQAAATYSRVSALIPALGEGIGGAIYEYIDTGLTNGTVYYYKLEVVETDNTSTFHGPIFTTPGNATYTPTASQTPTATRTRTAIPSSTPSLTFTASPIASLTTAPAATQAPTTGNQVATPLTPPPELTAQTTLALSSTQLANVPSQGSPVKPTSAMAGTQNPNAPTQSLYKDTVPPPGWISPTPAPFTASPAPLRSTPSPVSPAEPEPAANQPDLFQLISLGLLGAAVLGGVIYWSLHIRNPQK